MDNQKAEKKIFDLLSSKEFNAIMDGKRPYGELFVQCEIKIEVDPLVLEGMSGAVLLKKTQRGTPMYVEHFKYEDGLLKFLVGCPIHKNFYDIYDSEILFTAIKRPVATTFVDFCWIIGEGTTAKNAIEVNTPIRTDSELGDLTQVLPSKFADDLIEIMHSLNIEIFEGILGDTVMYGPHFIKKAG